MRRAHSRPGAQLCHSKRCEGASWGLGRNSKTTDPSCRLCRPTFSQVNPAIRSCPAWLEIEGFESLNTWLNNVVSATATQKAENRAILGEWTIRTEWISLDFDSLWEYRRKFYVIFIELDRVEHLCVLIKWNLENTAVPRVQDYISFQ